MEDAGLVGVVVRDKRDDQPQIELEDAEDS